MLSEPQLDLQPARDQHSVLMKAKEMVVAIAVVVGMLGTTTIGFEAGQASPDTKNIFTSISEKNQ